MLKAGVPEPLLRTQPCRSWSEPACSAQEFPTLPVCAAVLCRTHGRKPGRFAHGLQVAKAACLVVSI